MSLERETEVLNLFAEIGVILVLFVVGMEFSIMDRYVSNNIYSLNLSLPFCTYTLTSLEVLIISTIRRSEVEETYTSILILT